MGSARVFNGLGQYIQNIPREYFLVYFLPVGPYEKRGRDKHSQFIRAYVSKLLNVLSTGYISMLKYSRFVQDMTQSLGMD